MVSSSLPTRNSLVPSRVLLLGRQADAAALGRYEGRLLDGVDAVGLADLVHPLDHGFVTYTRVKKIATPQCQLWHTHTTAIDGSFPLNKYLLQCLGPFCSNFSPRYMCESRPQAPPRGP